MTFLSRFISSSNAHSATPSQDQQSCKFKFSNLKKPFKSNTSILRRVINYRHVSMASKETNMARIERDDAIPQKIQSRVSKPDARLNAAQPTTTQTSDLVKQLNQDGGVAVLGGGIAGLTAAIEARNSGVEPVTLYTPQKHANQFPLLNFRQAQVDHLRDLGVDQSLFSQVSGIPAQDLPDDNIFKDPVNFNIFYGDLIQNLELIAHAHGVQFQDKNIDAADIDGIAEKSGIVIVATGASKVSKDILTKLKVKQASNQTLMDMRVPIAEQKYVSALVEVSRAVTPANTLTTWRNPITHGAIVAARQNNLADQNLLWLNVQVPQSADNPYTAINTEVDRVFNQNACQNATVIDQTDFFTVRPRLNTGVDQSSNVPIITTHSEAGDRDVPVLLMGDILGSSGFRYSTGAGTADEQARQLGVNLRSMDQTSGTHRSTVTDWSNSLFQDWKGVTLNRLTAEGAVFQSDEQYFESNQGDNPLSRLQAFGTLDPGSTQRHMRNAISENKRSNKAGCWAILANPHLIPPDILKKLTESPYWQELELLAVDLTS